MPGIMKPYIVFFGEGLGDEFHKSVAIDKDEVSDCVIDNYLVAQYYFTNSITIQERLFYLYFLISG